MESANQTYPQPLDAIWSQALEKVSNLSQGLFRTQGRLVALKEGYAQVFIKTYPLLKIAKGKENELQQALSSVLGQETKVLMTAPPPHIPPVEPAKTIFDLAAEQKQPAPESKPPTFQTVEVFRLYSNLSEPEVWQFWENQIKLAVAASYVRARAAVQKEPLLPLEIVGELSVTLRQGEELIRVDLPTPSFPQPVLDFNKLIKESNLELERLRWSKEKLRLYLVGAFNKRSRQLLSEEDLLSFVEYLKSLPTPKEASPASTKKAKQYFIPPAPEWAKVKDGNFLIWFGKQHKLKWLKNLRDRDELKYCDWMASQEALPPEHREAVKNHIQSVLDEDMD